VSRGGGANQASRAGGTGRADLRPAVTPRPKLTSRAAVLAIVLCAIALTLAYPVREYISDRRQIDQLATANEHLATHVKHMRAEARSLNSPAVIAREARDNLHMCFPSQTCYEVILPASRHGRSAAKPIATPWYGRLWESVQKADGKSAR
jgi:cell division protein FtsB